MSSKNTVGRPTVMTKETLEKLEYAFSLGCTDKSACLYADISPDTLYEYQKKNPEFTERKAALKEQQVLKARSVVDNALNTGDVATARWLLERKCKDEFSTRTEIDPVKPIIKYVTAEETAAVDAHIDEMIGND